MFSYEAKTHKMMLTETGKVKELNFGKPEEDTEGQVEEDAAKERPLSEVQNYSYSNENKLVVINCDDKWIILSEH